MIHQTMAKMHHQAQKCRRQGLLTCYRRDVTFWDRDYMLRRSDGADRWLWLVKEAGTALGNLTHHRITTVRFWLTDPTVAGLRLKCFVVDVGQETVTEITRDHALQEVQP